MQAGLGRGRAWIRGTGAPPARDEPCGSPARDLAGGPAVNQAAERAAVQRRLREPPRSSAGSASCGRRARSCPLQPGQVPGRHHHRLRPLAPGGRGRPPLGGDRGARHLRRRRPRREGSPRRRRPPHPPAHRRAARRPGEHTFTFEPEHGARSEQTLLINVGEKNRPVQVLVNSVRRQRARDDDGGSARRSAELRPQTPSTSAPALPDAVPARRRTRRETGPARAPSSLASWSAGSAWSRWAPRSGSTWTPRAASTACAARAPPAATRP